MSLVDDVDLDCFRRGDLGASKLNEFDEVQSVRAGLGILGDSPLLGVRHVFVALGRNRAIIIQRWVDRTRSIRGDSRTIAFVYSLPRLVDNGKLLLLLVTRTAVEVDIERQSLTHRGMLYDKIK